MKPKDGDNKNEIDLFFTYAIYSGGELTSYPTDVVKGDITTTNVAADSTTDASQFTFKKQLFSLPSAQDSGIFMYAFATSAAVISTFASLI